MRLSILLAVDLSSHVFSIRELWFHLKKEFIGTRKANVNALEKLFASAQQLELQNTLFKDLV